MSTTHYHQAALDLATDRLLALTPMRLDVIGRSMAPLIGLGDAVSVEGVDPARLRRGDVVVVRQADMLMTHRLVGVNGQGWYLKGDACRYVDAPVMADALWGRVVAVQRQHANKHLDLHCHRWVVLNRLIGGLAALQWQLGRVLGVPQHSANRSPLWLRFLLRLVAELFMLVTRLLVSIFIRF